MYEGPEDLVEKMKSLSVSQDCSLGGEFRFRYALPQFKYDSSGSQCQHRYAYWQWSVMPDKNGTLLLDLQIVQLHWWVRKVSWCRLKPVSRTCTISRHHRSVSRAMLRHLAVVLAWKKNWIRSSSTTNLATIAATPSLILRIATFAALQILSCQTVLITPLQTWDKIGCRPHPFTPLQKLSLCIPPARRSTCTPLLVITLGYQNRICQHPTACLLYYSPTKNNLILCLTGKSLGQPFQWRTHLPLNSAPGVCWRLPRASYKNQVDTQTFAYGEMFCQTWPHLLMVRLALTDICVCFLRAGPLIIQNANGIQIGSNNQMNIKSCDSYSLSSSASGFGHFSIQEAILKYGKFITTVLSIKQNH